VLTRWEIVPMIAGYATRPGFFKCLEGLPPEVVEGLRGIASGAPAHPEDVINGNGHYDPMTAEGVRAMRPRGPPGAYRAGRTLRTHFFPDRPLPPFEPRRRVGVVSDSTVVDGSVVLFGVEDSLIINDHPVHCAPPSGGLIVTSVVRQCHVRGPGDEAG